METYDDFILKETKVCNGNFIEYTIQSECLPAESVLVLKTKPMTLTDKFYIIS